MEPRKLILLHGALGAASQWQSLITALGPTVDCRTLEFEGHGATPAPDRPFRIEHFADNLFTFIASNNLAPADIFGYSMGGYAALCLARKQPALIGRVMTLATKFAWTPESARRESGMLDAEALLAKVPAYVSVLEKRHTALGWRTMLSRTAEMMQTLGRSPALTDATLAGIRQHVCVGIGEWDTMVSVDESARAANALPNGELRVFQEMPHPWEKVDVGDVAKAVKAWMMV